MGRFLNFIKRPFVGDQTTGRLAYQQSQSYAYAGVNGDAGFTVRRTIAPMQAAGIAVGPTHKLNDPSVTGNNNVNIELQALSDNRSI